VEELRIIADTLGTTVSALIQDAPSLVVMPSVKAGENRYTAWPLSKPERMAAFLKALR
jgi:hypothetical protein